MSHPRTAFRAAARAALAADPHFAGFTGLPAWAQNIDVDALPVFAVATPRETKTRDTLDSSARETALMVIVKRLGGDDLEDTLDHDSVEVERIILAAVDTDETPCLLDETTVEIDGGGIKRVGSLIMKFTVTTWPVEPFTEA